MYSPKGYIFPNSDNESSDFFIFIAGQYLFYDTALSLSNTPTTTFKYFFDTDLFIISGDFYLALSGNELILTSIKTPFELSNIDEPFLISGKVYTQNIVTIEINGNEYDSDIILLSKIGYSYSGRKITIPTSVDSTNVEVYNLPESQQDTYLFTNPTDAGRGLFYFGDSCGDTFGSCDNPEEFCRIDYSGSSNFICDSSPFASGRIGEIGVQGGSGIQGIIGDKGFKGEEGEFGATGESDSSWSYTFLALFVIMSFFVIIGLFFMRPFFGYPEMYFFKPEKEI